MFETAGKARVPTCHTPRLGEVGSRLHGQVVLYTGLLEVGQGEAMQLVENIHAQPEKLHGWQW